MKSRVATPLEASVAENPAGAAVPADPVISGHSAIDFHASVPTALTFVERLARPPAIHARTWSTLTGPYSFPSPPMIVYMGAFRHHSGETSTPRALGPVSYTHLRAHETGRNL